MHKIFDISHNWNFPPWHFSINLCVIRIGGAKITQMKVVFCSSPTKTNPTFLMPIAFWCGFLTIMGYVSHRSRTWIPRPYPLLQSSSHCYRNFVRAVLNSWLNFQHSVWSETETVHTTTGEDRRGIAGERITPGHREDRLAETEIA